MNDKQSQRVDELINRGQSMGFSVLIDPKTNYAGVTYMIVSFVSNGPVGPILRWSTIVKPDGTDV